MSAPPNQSVIKNDSLEYFIKFPTPNFRHNREIGESDYVFVYNETNVPIVLLLGWAGCKDRYLMKYSKIYEDRGLITVRYTAPVENLFFRREAMKPIGDKIVKLIYDMNFDTHPLMFHVFSNGGAYLYQHIWLAFREYSPTVQIRAVIFDSAPGDRHMVALYRAISAIYGKQKPFNFLVSWLTTLFLTVLWFVQENFHKFGLLFGADNPAKAHPFENLKNQDCYAPQLFLYSKHDKLVPYTDVEKFANHRKGRGIHVQLQCFKNVDAEHVKLFASQPQRNTIRLSDMVKEKPNQARIYDKDGFRRRAACICVRYDAESEVLLVTSSRNINHWIVPGGGVDTGEEPAVTAVREVLEEAGVVGSLGRSLGVFEVMVDSSREHKHRTEVFVMTVTEELEEWEESRTIGRVRKWFNIDDALEKLAVHKPTQQQYLEELKHSKNSTFTQPSSPSS